MAVFVLDQRKRPLMPCSERKARLLLSRKRAVVHRQMPFTIRLKDRLREESAVQTLVLKLDPGSHTTGMALTRVEQTQEGEVHHALHLSELTHRGEQVHQALLQRAGYRRRRRSANLRYRSPRFQNRRRAPGWLPRPYARGSRMCSPGRGGIAGVPPSAASRSSGSSLMWR